MCHEIFYLNFFHVSNPSGILINRVNYFRIWFRFWLDIFSQSSKYFTPLWISHRRVNLCVVHNTVKSDYKLCFQPLSSSVVWCISWRQVNQITKKKLRSGMKWEFGIVLSLKIALFKERQWVNCSCHCLQKSDYERIERREWFPLIAYYKTAICSHCSLKRVICNLFFHSQNTSDLLKQTKKWIHNPGCDAHRGAWLPGGMHTRKLFKNLNKSAKSKPNSNIFCPLSQGLD